MRHEALHHLLVYAVRSREREAGLVQITLKIKDILRVGFHRGFGRALLIFQPRQKEFGVIGELGAYGFDTSHGRTS